MKKIGLLVLFFLCCQAAVAFQSDPITQDLRQVATSDFMRFGADKDHDDSSIAFYWMTNVQREIHQIKAEIHNIRPIRRPELTQNNPDVLDRLEESMAPIRELERELRDFNGYRALPNAESRGKERQRVVEELVAALSDPQIANETFAILGKEHAAFMVKKRVIDNLDSTERNTISDWSTFGTILKHQNFHNFLNLTDAQKNLVERGLAGSISQLADEVKQLTPRLASVWHDRWAEILDVLDADQRRLAKQLVGKPVEWFRVPKTGKLEPDGETWLCTSMTYCGSNMGQKLKDKEISQYTKQELDDAGIELFNSVVYEMLYCTALWDEYELVDDQKDRLTNEIRKHLDNNALALPERPERIDSLLQQNADYPETVKGLLLPNQLEWFRQIELQILLGRKYDSSVGLLNPKMAKFLGLDDQQKGEIQEIAKEFEASANEVLKQIKMKRQIAQKDCAAELMEILTADQVAKLEASTGRSLGFIGE